MGKAVLQRIGGVWALPDLTPLAAESEGEGFRHIRRLLDDYASGMNRFDRPGEALFAVVMDGAVVGVGGLNRGGSVGEGSGENREALGASGETAEGRVRRVYVSAGCRRSGIGRMLMAEIIAHARAQRFERLVLRTYNPEADQFYLSLGFSRISGEGGYATHKLQL